MEKYGTKKRIARRETANASTVRMLFLLLGGVSLGACFSPQRIFVAETDQMNWKSTRPAEVAFCNDDTSAIRSIDLVVRCNSDFGYDRLNLAVTTVTPDGYRWCDTVTLPVDTDPLYDGRYYDIEQSYRPVLRLNQEGRYLFRFAPVMPGSSVRGVAAVGIHIR